MGNLGDVWGMYKWVILPKCLCNVSYISLDYECSSLTTKVILTNYNAFNHFEWFPTIESENLNRKALSSLLFPLPVCQESVVREG